MDRSELGPLPGDATPDAPDSIVDRLVWRPLWSPSTLTRIGRFEFACEGLTDLKGFPVQLEPVYLFYYTRSPKEFHAALLEGPELREVREGMQAAGCSCVLESSGAKAFFHPQYASLVSSALTQYSGRLYGSHVVIQGSLVPALHEAVASIRKKHKVRQKGEAKVLVDPSRSSSGSASSCCAPICLTCFAQCVKPFTG